eukprot:TRINITY_DN3899_c0_g1_i1.p1 TRINITY_DN3899_c0_g1~~TRINITY_DN3899_c0_g1_i1.p1  ORF type:complete len:390 (-),score=141.40 TRINITY_DN3899_c0_g1_i1:37-1206(-)
MTQFYYIKQNVKLAHEHWEPAKNINMSTSTERVLREYAEREAQLEKEKKERAVQEAAVAAGAAAAAASSGFVTKSSLSTAKPMSQRVSAQAPSATSTAFSAAVCLERDPFDVVKHTKKKGFAALVTNRGVLNLQLHCDVVPKTTENFLALCESGYYNNTVFHRLIPNFMIQGGDPTGTGKGGESIWKKDFKDEIRANLKHTEAGILSMANRGPNTNSSQFFITFDAAPHLDGKHTVFGKVVGGLDVLQRLESVETDEEDHPLEDVVLQSAVVYFNPFNELDKEEEEQRLQTQEREREQEALHDEANRGQWYSRPTPVLPKTDKKGVGKYIGLLSTKPQAAVSQAAPQSERAKVAAERKRLSVTFEYEAPLPKARRLPVHRGAYGDFNKW